MVEVYLDGTSYPVRIAADTVTAPQALKRPPP